MTRLLILPLLLCSISLHGQESTIYGKYRMDFFDPIGYDGCCSEHGTLILNRDNSFVLNRTHNQGDYECKDFSVGTFKVIGKKVFFTSQIPDSLKVFIDLGSTEEIENEQLRITFLTGRIDNWRILSAKFYEITDSLTMIELLPISYKPKFSELADTTNGQFVPIKSNFDTVAIVFNKPVAKNIFIKSPVGNNLTLNTEHLKSNNIIVNYDTYRQCSMGFFDFTGFQFRQRKNRLVGILRDRKNPETFVRVKNDK